MRKVSSSLKYGLYSVIFIFAIGGAVASYVNSTFINSLIDIKFVGLIFSLSYVLAILFLAILPEILPRIGNLPLLISIISLDALCLFLLGTSHDQTALLISIMGHLALGSVAIFSFDIFMEHLSLRKKTGGVRGFFLTIINLGWLISPFISGHMADSVGIQSIYQFSFFVAILVIAILLLSFRPFKDKKYKTISLKKVIVVLHKNKNIRLISISNFLLQFFYSVMVIYAPLYLSQSLGFSWELIGVIFTVMLLPFVLFQLPLGRLMDSSWGEKEVLQAGFIIAGLSTLIFALTNNGSLTFYAIILFLTRVGAAMIEVGSETYFFKHIGEKDSGVIAFFRNLGPMAYIVAPIIATLLFIFGSYGTVFATLSIVMLVGYFMLERLKDTN